MLHIHEPFVPGSSIPLEGRATSLQWMESLPRNPALIDGTLRCGGPEAAFAGRIERYLRAEARSRLSEATAATAEKAGVSVKSVAVGNASSRWGSCSSGGYDSIVAHEHHCFANARLAVAYPGTYRGDPAGTRQEDA